MSRSYECHGHLMMDGADFASARKRHCSGVDTDALRASLDALRAAGVTYFRDGGDAYGVSALGREIAPEYGIEVVTPVFAIYKRGYYGSIVGRDFIDIASFRRRIEELRNAKGDFVKLMLSGIITFRAFGELSCDGLDTEEIKEMVHIAHCEGYSVMAHVNGEQTVRAAAAAGVDSVEHGYFADRESLDIMSEKQIIWVPTLAAVEAFIGREGIGCAVAERTLDEQLDCVARARTMKIPVAAGSDSGAVGVPHGAGTLREYELLAGAGLTPDEIESANEMLRKKFAPRGGSPVV
ncbi:MAG: amidohydrolase family protein [Oscillospiraceae bacterium]|nr:amidohydrolase family protein [Oscillospiraceae bacterium]MBR5070918.1 amidohydrolase family protein [Oscillospiraceae bacterium]